MELRVSALPSCIRENPAASSQPAQLQWLLSMLSMVVLCVQYFLCSYSDQLQMKLSGVREETLQSNEGDQSAKAGSQHICRRKWRSPHKSGKGMPSYLLVRSMLIHFLDIFCRGLIRIAVSSGAGTTQWTVACFL